MCAPRRQAVFAAGRQVFRLPALLSAQLCQPVPGCNRSGAGESTCDPQPVGRQRLADRPVPSQT
jgi:hypothetical protein